MLNLTCDRRSLIEVFFILIIISDAAHQPNRQNANIFRKKRIRQNDGFEAVVVVQLGPGIMWPTWVRIQSFQLPNWMV